MINLKFIVSNKTAVFVALFLYGCVPPPPPCYVFPVAPGTCCEPPQYPEYCANDKVYSYFGYEIVDCRMYGYACTQDPKVCGIGAACCIPLAHWTPDEEN